MSSRESRTAGRIVGAVVLALALFAAFMAWPARAQGVPCGDYATMTETRAKTTGEAKVGSGIVHGGGVMELYANPLTGSWTSFMIRPDGLTCIVASGVGWTPALS